HGVVAHWICGIAGAYVKRHGLVARVDERQYDGTVRSIDVRMNIQLIRQGARGPDTFFLRRDTEDHTAQTGNEVREAPSRELRRRRQKSVGARQIDMILIRVGKVENRGQVTSHRPAPWGNIGFLYSETLLDELDHRRVIEDLGIDVASLGPG